MEISRTQDNTPFDQEKYRKMNLAKRFNPKYKHKLSIAPMMEVTHRHFRFFARLLSQHCTLWTDMYHSNTLVHSKKMREKLMVVREFEHPIVCQLGGNEPESLRQAAILVEEAGFDEIDLNCGCPSPKVTNGAFGACLMKDPKKVAECLTAMMSAVDIPVHVKCRIGVDDFDDYQFVKEYVEEIQKTGCKQIIVHARKAYLKGLNPAQNRSVPPLKYDVVLQLAQEFPDIDFSINGGFKTYEQVDDILQPENKLIGCMVGRAAYLNPWNILADADRRFYDQKNLGLSRKEILKEYGIYMDKQIEIEPKITWGFALKPVFFLFKDKPSNIYYRRYLADQKAMKKYTKFSEYLQSASDLYESIEPEVMNERPPLGLIE